MSQLQGSERGFYILRGKVRRISESRSAIWINLEHNVALRITREDLQYFESESLKRFDKKRLEARGWLYKRKRQLRMRIRHPQDLSILTTNQ